MISETTQTNSLHLAICMGDSSKLNTKKNKSKEQMEMIFGVSPVNTYKVIHDAALSFKKRFIEFEGKVSNTS